MRKYFLIGIASLSVLFTSCLKDKNVDDRKYGIEGVDEGKIIELAADGSHLISYALDFINVDTIFDFLEIRLAADQVAPEDITVELSLTNSLDILADYDAANGTSLTQFPLDLYTLPDGLTATIPAGSRSVFLKVGLNPSKFDASLTYALGFEIANVNKPGYTISGNFGTVITSFSAKNEYDGRYEVTGTVIDANGTYKDVNPTVVDLITVSGNAVIFYSHDFDYPNFVIQNIVTGAYTNSGVRPRFTFDNSTRALIGLVNANDGSPLTFSPSSIFNESDRSFDLDWYFIGTRFHVTEHYSYMGPRD